MRFSPKAEAPPWIVSNARAGRRAAPRGREIAAYISKVSRLVLDDDRGPDRCPVPEGRHRAVRHIHAAVRTGVEVGARAVPRAPRRVMDEIAAADELHRPVGPGRWVPPW